MAILRKNNRERYTVVSQDIIRDERLSLKEMGLLIRMLSLPDDWEFSENGLMLLFKKDGQSSIRSGLKSLEEYGYLKRERVRDSNGRLNGFEWRLSEVPFQDEEYPYLENPSMVNPNLGNRPQLNTNIPNTNKSNTNSIYSDVICYLNDKTFSYYRATTGKTQALINARVKEGFTLEDFKTVIDKKCDSWLGTEMAKYLRPETLFGTKFESYLNEIVVKGGANDSRRGTERCTERPLEDYEEQLRRNADRVEF